MAGFKAHNENELRLETVYFKTVDSTNSASRRYVKDKPRCPVLFLADSQTNGHGRMGRTFYSPCKTGLYMTLLTEYPQNDCVPITAVTAVCVCQALFEYFGIFPKIKWVNDLYLNSKKVAGILAESFAEEERRYIAIGIGINLTTSDFPDDIREKAGGLIATDTEISRDDRDGLARLISYKIIGALKNPDVSEYMKKYEENLLVIGEKIKFLKDGETLFATAMGINSKGELLVRTADGENLVLGTGEISVFKADGSLW